MNKKSQAKVLKILKRCRNSPAFFIDNFCVVEHPSAGIIPFKLFSYQKQCLKDFQDHTYTIFRKCRQCGISTLTGAYALWFAMFHGNKKILIVSKRDIDAKEYLRRNVKVLYYNLPEWMRNIFTIDTDNEHTFRLANGSVIQSMTSSKDTLRSSASSLNIIDEVAFIPKMDEMWASGQPTLQHGGSVICISTVNGVGNWYWETWQDAHAEENDFHPIVINWWDMDWKLEYKDPHTEERRSIEPCKDIRKCTPEEAQKYGPYWSPWLEEQYRQLTQGGNSAKFRQEVLAEFLGSGETVLDRETLQRIENSVRTSNAPIRIENVNYVNPISGERTILEFNNRLHCWQEPVCAELDPKTGEYKGGHLYIAGVDVASGESADWQTAQIFDITEREQVAELQIKAAPLMFAMMVDYIGRLYNNAFIVVERTGIGQTICSNLNDDLSYPNLYRQRKKMAGVRKMKSQYGQIGFPTNNSTKPVLVGSLVDNMGEEGFVIRSHRLYKELSMFVRLTNNKVGAEPGNHDDLVIATCLAMHGIEEANRSDRRTLMPFQNIGQIKFGSQTEEAGEPMLFPNDERCIAPVNKINIASGSNPKSAVQDELRKFSSQLGGIPKNANRSVSSGKKYTYEIKRPINKPKD